MSQVEVTGVRRYEISIEVSEDTLRRHGLTFEQVAGAVGASSLDLPGGAVKTEGGEILLRTKGQKYLGTEFEDVVVRAQPGGSQLYLSDIATVIDGFEDSDTASRFDGKAAVLIQVYRVGQEGALDVASVTKHYLEELEPTLPEGVSLATWDDDSIVLNQRIGLLLRNARLGLILVFFCLSLFLNLRLAFWTTMGIPISFLGGLWLAPMFGVSINMISLFAFIIALGIVVDDAIVVGENIYRYLETGQTTDRRRHPRRPRDDRPGDLRDHHHDRRLRATALRQRHDGQSHAPDPDRRHRGSADVAGRSPSHPARPPLGPRPPASGS